MTYPHVEEEQAFVWRGGGKRFFTRKAALRNAAKAIIAADLRGQGLGREDCDYATYQQAVAQVVGKIESGETPEVDWDALSGPTTPYVGGGE